MTYICTMNKKGRFQLAFSHESIFVAAFHYAELNIKDYPIRFSFTVRKGGIEDDCYTFANGYDTQENKKRIAAFYQSFLNKADV